MNPGELDRRILLEKATWTQQANNELTAGWAEYGYRWAKFEQTGENEVLEDEALNIYSRVKFTVRFERINESDYRVKYNNKVYNINGINPIGRENYIELDCESRSVTNFKT
ncbi:MAG: phage head closure protein [Nitrosomonadaceae bacterium]